MTGAGLIVAALAILWLGALTMVTLALIRQTALLTIRVQRTGGQYAPAADGLMTGREIPFEVAAALPEMAAGVTYVLLVSATCAPCRELAPQLGSIRLPERVTALVAGDGELGESLARLLPPEIRVIRDPDATQIANHLGIQSTPFVMELEGGRVTGKAYLHEATDFRRLVEARENSAPTREHLRMAEVIGRGN